MSVRIPRYLFMAFAAMFLLSQAVLAQTTQFTYQGKLVDSGNLANGSYDLQFKLFDTVTVGTGTQQGSTVTVSNVTVTNGVFTVSLDFGACPACFNGTNRFLEIAVKPTSGSNFLTLSPRQQITSTPYAVKSLNAAAADGLSVACVNCVTSSQIGSVNGSAVTGTIPVASVPAGSGNYIQNQNVSAQPSANFNISGTGTADTFSATTQFNLGGSRILSTAGTNNLFVGTNAGAANTTGNANAFFGQNAGQSNVTGTSNEFFGFNAGNHTTTGSANVFVGDAAGYNNTTANSNAFFGYTAGFNNTTASQNSFFGTFAGFNNTTGGNNSFFGYGTGGNNTTGNSNTFYGYNTGNTNTTGSGNTLVGNLADVGSDSLTNATALGANAQVTASNALVLGSINGVNGATADTKVGIGTTAPTARLHVIGDGLFTGNLTVSGTLIASLSGSTVNAITQYNFGGQRVLSAAGSGNLFAGINAGANPSNTGSFNAFFGSSAGQANTTGIQNAFFGADAGLSNTTGFNNAFFGDSVGSFNTTGSNNAFFGEHTGFNNTTGNFNTFIGRGADFDVSNPTGSNNTLLGSFSRVTSGITNATAIGANAIVAQSNSLILGSINGVNGATTDTKVGIGITNPISALHVKAASPVRIIGETSTLSGSESVDFFARNTPFASDLGGMRIQRQSATGDIDTILFAGPSGSPAVERLRVRGNGNVGIGTTAPVDLLQVTGDMRVGTGTTGCVKDADATVIAGTCSSDARLKRDIMPFPHLLDKVAQLQPVHFYWRTEEFKDRHFGVRQSYGLIAQEVEKVMPELVTEDEQGYKAVNYSKLPLLTLQAVKELKTENDILKNEIVVLKKKVEQIEALKRLVCKTNPDEEICKP